MWGEGRVNYIQYKYTAAGPSNSNSEDCNFKNQKVGSDQNQQSFWWSCTAILSTKNSDMTSWSVIDQRVLTRTSVTGQTVDTR